MINSAISSSHHYYLAFFESKEIRYLSSIISCFPNKSDFEIIGNSKSKQEGIYHLQLELENAYGSESLLNSNFSKTTKSGDCYWYDFYFGPIDLDKKLFFICYPYSKLGKYIQSNFNSNSLHPNYFRADVPSVLHHMRIRSDKGFSRVEKQGLELDITKYTAEIKEEANAKKVSLIGANPLNSKIFDVLNNAEGVNILPTALKLKCFKSDVGEIELSFDRLGNFRFWLKKDAQNINLPMIKFAHQFFSEIKSLEKTQFLSKHTLLEDE